MKIIVSPESQREKDEVQELIEKIETGGEIPLAVWSISHTEKVITFRKLDKFTSNYTHYVGVEVRIELDDEKISFRIWR